mmetsp:Transcript_27505/g.33371  ORF Transcript_27505/g.33371 Transcript_27505/m.33371 type:complete len:572 (-) Transcript_27505:448-2163(-)
MLTFLLLCLPITTTAQTQKFLLHPTSQLINSHERNLSLLQQHPAHERNSAVYATLAPFLSSLHPDERDTFQKSFEEARRYSRHERFYRESERDRKLRGRQLQMYSDPPVSADSDAMEESVTVNSDGSPILEDEGETSTAPASEEIIANDTSDIDPNLIKTYQPAPLLQGYGTHYATIWVGSPPQRQSVIVDTGSHFTAFPCVGCEECGEEHHTDKYFDPSLSQSFYALGCNECIMSRCESGRCVFSEEYTEGSSWKAYQGKDNFFVGKNQAYGRDDPVDNSFAIPFMFGCQIRETGLFATQLANGIMGMSAHEATLPRQMFDKGKIKHKVFSLCFRLELSVSKEGIVAGAIVLGGVDSTLHTSPMLYAQNMVGRGWYTVYVRNVYLRQGGGQSVVPEEEGVMIVRLPVDSKLINSEKGVIVDSGTTDTYLHESIQPMVNEAWKRITGAPYSNNEVSLSPDQLNSLPTVLIQLSAWDEDSAEERLGDPRSTVGLAGDLDPRHPHDVILAIPATHYMEYIPLKDVYVSRLYFSETRGGVIGANAMQGHDVSFDWDNSRVGFAESGCDVGVDVN